MIMLLYDRRIYPLDAVREVITLNVIIFKKKKKKKNFLIKVVKSK